uniref:myelin-associated glycoprotein-like n=1 Tax=Semicossyphus pulcher TaxID=241346 RepID=UPI0037E7323B
MGSAYLIRLLLTGFSILQQVRSWSINVPESVTAVEGSCVAVPCWTQPHLRVTWYQYQKMNYPVVYDRFHNIVEKQFRGRTSVPGNSTAGNCTLIIKNVRMADNNLQVYVWINPDSRASQKFYDQTVTISVERKAPKLSILKQMVEGETFQANCSISHSCPSSPPSIRWTGSQILENSSLKAINEKVFKQWMYTETLHGIATYEMQNSKISCSALFHDLTTDSQEITLNILYKPVNVSLILEMESVINGDSVIVECAANCNPQPHTYSWLQRQLGQDITTINTTQSKRTFDNVTTKTSFSCIAHNDIGAGQSNWLDLDVKHAPVILSESSCHLLGEVVKCVCQVEVFPNASIHWTIDGNDTLSSSFSFVFTNKKHVIFGEISGPAQSHTNITCTATNDLGSDTKQLSVHNLSKTASLSMWLVALTIPGIALLFGCAQLIYRKYSECRLLPGSVCNTTILLRRSSLSEYVQVEQRYDSHQRAHVEDAQSSPCRTESDPEEDRLSCVYDNDFVEQMRQSRAQQHQNNTTAPQRDGEIELPEKAVECNMEDYLNG